MTKRLCLLAGFHPKNQVSDYVVYYAKALAELAEVYYLADCEMPATELAKLAPYTKGAWGYHHGKYDFGSWQELINKLGWTYILSFDECFFVNDSVFAPLFPLKPIIQKGTCSACDAWALNSFEGSFFASFFFVLKKRALTNTRMQQFFNTVKRQSTADSVIQEYEKPLTTYLNQEKLNCAVFENKILNVFDYWREAVLSGFPILKIGVFTRNYYEPEWGTDWRTFLKQHTNYPIELIDQHLSSLGIDVSQFNSFKYRLRSWRNSLRRWRKKIISIHFCKGTRHISIFGITLIHTSPSNTKNIIERL